MAHIIFKQQTNLEDDNFFKFKEIYIDSFPPNERNPFELIVQRMQSGKTKVYLGYHKGKVVCFGSLSYFDNSEFVLLDYMAVESKNKNKKFGTELFKFLRYIAFENNKNLLLEVEHPSFGNNTDERKKRINFYLKNGALVLRNTPYILPPLDGSKPTEMILMVLPLTADLQFEKYKIVSIIKRLYNELYQRNSDDELLNSFIQNIPNRVVLTKNIPRIIKNN